jgi:glycine betaine/proline transport system ATP-binding protein
VRNGELGFQEAIITELPTAAPDTLISDLIPVAAEAPFPIAVVTPENRLLGIVTKAAVLASLI